MQPQSHYNYSAADIERYHNGSMTDAEMHTLEKAALDDPFLADAIDGYVHTKTPEADMAFLKEQLQQRSRKVMVLPNSRHRLFLSIAAMFILLAGFGWLAFQFSNNTRQNIADQKQLAPPAARSLPQAADSINTIPEESMVSRKAGDEKQVQSPVIESDTGPRIPKQTRARTKAQTKHNPEDAAASTFSKPHTAAPQSNAESNMTASRVSENTFKAQVVDAQKNAVPFATITNQQNKAIARTDTAGRFSIAAPDSNLTVAITSAGYKQQQLTLVPTDSATTIVLQPAMNALSEGVLSRKAKPRDTAVRVRLEAVEPIGGLSRFNTFVNESIESPEDLDALSKNKEVVLTFDVDPSGNAVNILVEKSSCSSCDTMAVRLIQQGTKWKKTESSVKAKARIRF
jgi:hypothetical protein